MICRIANPNDDIDTLAWVTKATFDFYVNWESLRNRLIREIEDCYNLCWFRCDYNDVIFFIPPVFGWDGYLRPIQGRHRAEILYRHIDPIPMRLARIKEWPEDKLSEIVHRFINENEFVELPDLPIKAMPSLFER